MTRLLPAVTGLIAMLGAHAALARPPAPLGDGQALTQRSDSLRPVLGDKPKIERPKDQTIIVMPEPGSLALLASGMIAAGLIRRARRRQKDSHKTGPRR